MKFVFADGWAEDLPRELVRTEDYRGRSEVSINKSGPGEAKRRGRDRRRVCLSRWRSELRYYRAIKICSSPRLEPPESRDHPN